MLKFDKILNLLFIIFVLIFSSCNNKQENVKIISLLKDRDIYLKLKFNDYGSIYNLTYDSINKWIKDSLYITNSMFYKNWELDSVFVFSPSLASMLLLRLRSS